MFWLSYIYPQTIERLASSYNKDIRVVLERGEYKILVSGSPQSGPYIRSLWQYVFKSFVLRRLPAPDKVLVLGVAGGTVIHVVSKYAPFASIVGVDIDPVMIGLGRKYFHLRTVAKVRFLCEDAKLYVARAKGKTFDWIVVDLFFGSKIPRFISSGKFLKHLRRLLRPGGLVVINSLRGPSYQAINKDLERRMRVLIGPVTVQKKLLNRFYCAKIMSQTMIK